MFWQYSKSKLSFCIPASRAHRLSFLSKVGKVHAMHERAPRVFGQILRNSSVVSQNVLLVESIFYDFRVKVTFQDCLRS